MSQGVVRQWLGSMFPPRRLLPLPRDIEKFQELYKEVFGTKSGRELLEFWLENVVLTNPRSTDPNECIAYAAKCAFIEDIARALDRAENPHKYLNEKG